MQAFRTVIGIGVLLIAAALPGATFAGEPDLLDLGQWEGQVILLDFWASWCGPCAESFPWMSEMSRKYGEQGLVIVAINLDAERPNADRFLADHPSSFKHVFDPDGILAEAYGVQTMPTSIIIDRSGHPVARHQGFHPGKPPATSGTWWPS
ncbi:MAG: TlpA disulfide reductase family protein [Acidobacteriota bacterium]